MFLKVTRINERYHAQLLFGETKVDPGSVVDEMACELKADVGYICREMLRWADKMGMSSAWTEAARKRQEEKPKGKVWYKQSLTGASNV
jgi:hypothetical protein